MFFKKVFFKIISVIIFLGIFYKDAQMRFFSFVRHSHTRSFLAKSNAKTGIQTAVQVIYIIATLFSLVKTLQSAF